jgi:hypothetical protein
MQVVPKINEKLSQEFFGPSTSMFVGHNFYPNVYVGPLAPLETDKLDMIDSPQRWFGLPYGDIIQFRSLVLRSKQRENIFSGSRFVEQMQELSMAARPTDVELGFKKRPRISFEFNDMVQPMGPSGTLSSFRVTENPKIPVRLEKIVRDDVKAAEAGFMMYRKGVDIHKIVTVLSSGVLGLREKRKLVPTRWSITATDSMLADRVLEKVKDYRSVNEYMVYESEYLDNHFVILLMPGSWEFENFEAWAPGTTWSFNLKKTEILEEYEPYRGRTSYANLQAGGFYASRFSIITSLNEMKRQARVVAFREISEGYTVPLGVWVVRSTARHAFDNDPLKFETKEQALDHIRTRLKLPLSEYVSQSKILRQKRVGDFLKTGFQGSPKEQPR